MDLHKIGGLNVPIDQGSAGHVDSKDGRQAFEKTCM